MNKGIIYYSIGVIFTVLLVGCKEKKITITKHYVINPNWSETNNSFAVKRMELKYSDQIIDPKDPSESELHYGLIEDANFSYNANVEYNGENYSRRKVYFNKDNGFTWWGNLHKSNSAKKTLGDLQQNTWYLLGGLSEYKTLYYIYIDNLDSLRIYKVNNMTNY